MLYEVNYCKMIMKNNFNKPLKMTDKDEENLKKADECHICGKKYMDKDKRVRDHCHVTGKYRGSAHQDCNFNFQLTDKIPVIFDYLRGYVSHFIMQKIGQIAKNHTYKNKKGQEQEMNINGKTMENISKRVDIRLVTNQTKLLKMTSKPTYVSSKIFNKNLVAVHKIKETLTLNKAAHVGMSILDLSKTLMYDFRYSYLKQKYGDKAKLLFTDTDSLTYEIETTDVYKDF